MSDGPLLYVDDAIVDYRGGHRASRRRAVRAVDHVTLELPRGEVLGIVGESGSGKSSLARAIVQLVKLSSGRVIFDGVDLTSASSRTLRRMRRRVQMVFQDPDSSLDPRQRVGSLLGEPLRISGYREDRASRIEELLSLVGLDASAVTRYPHEFSGGQRQRLGIARALAMSPELIVCDEITSALDASVQAQLINLLNRLRAKLGLSYIFISHNLPVVAAISDRIAVMYQGQIVEILSADHLGGHARHPYTRSLLAAVPRPDPRIERRRPRAEVRSRASTEEQVTNGCRYLDRCGLHRDQGSPAECRTAGGPSLEYDQDGAVRCYLWTRQAHLAAAGGVRHEDLVRGGGVPPVSMPQDVEE